MNKLRCAAASVTTQLVRLELLLVPTGRSGLGHCRLHAGLLVPTGRSGLGHCRLHSGLLVPTGRSGLGHCRLHSGLLVLRQCWRWYQGDQTHCSTLSDNSRFDRGHSVFILFEKKEPLIALGSHQTTGAPRGKGGGGANKIVIFKKSTKSRKTF